MLRTSFFLKLLGTYVALVVVTAGIFSLFHGRELRQAGREAADSRLAAHAELFALLAAPMLEGPEAAPGARERLETTGRLLRLRCTVIAADGSVLADSHVSEGRSRLKPEQIQEALATRPRADAAQSARVDEEERVRYLSRPLRTESGDGAGAVRVAIDLRDVEDREGELFTNVLVTAGFSVLIAGLLGLFVARRISRPVQAVKRAATGVASGDYETRVEVRSTDEFGELSQAFNIMVRELARRMETITTDRNKLLTILGGMVEGVIAVDAEERVMHINQVAARWIQTTAEGSIGRLIWEVTRKVEVCEALTQAMDSGDEVHDEIVLPDSREDQILELVAAPLQDSRGATAGAVVVLHDVTRLRKLEVVRSDFVANVSHELKTPLTVIRGTVETMLDDAASMPENVRARFLEKMLSQANRLGSLVSDLLVLSRVESDRGTHDFDDVDLRSVLEESMRGLLPVAERKSIRFERQMPSRPVLVLGDPEALRQVLDNLLDNALKYSGPGERVCARLELRNGIARFEVADTGIGIAPQDRERIFERFYRVDKARSRELGGTGLGLSIVKHIVLAHGGEIGVDSAPGQGSTFWVELPGIE